MPNKTWITDHKVTWQTYVSIACQELRNPTISWETKNEHQKRLLELAQWKDDEIEFQEAHIAKQRREKKESWQ